MNTDPTENIRREDQARINAEAAERAELVKQYGMVWSTDELREAFEVLGFMAPYVVVRSKYTGKKGRCSSNNLRGSTSNGGEIPAHPHSGGGGGGHLSLPMPLLRDLDRNTSAPL